MWLKIEVSLESTLCTAVSKQYTCVTCYNKYHKMIKIQNSHNLAIQVTVYTFCRVSYRTLHYMFPDYVSRL